MTTYLIRPAPARSEHSYVLSDGHLTGPDWDLDLTGLTDLGFTSYSAYGRMIWRLDLAQGDQKHSITANLPKTGGAATANFAAFHGLITSLASDLSHRNPTLRVGFGERGTTRQVIFGIGILSALGGLAIGVGALANGRGAQAALPAILSVLFGAGLIQSNAPWTKPTRIDPADLPAVLTRLAGG